MVFFNGSQQFCFFGGNRQVGIEFQFGLLEQSGLANGNGGLQALGQPVAAGLKLRVFSLTIDCLAQAPNLAADLNAVGRQGC